MSEQPKGIEPVPVQLTRIEGTVNLIAYQMSEVKAEVTKLSERVTAVELVQASTAGASGSWKTWLPILTGFAATGAALVALFVK